MVKEIREEGLAAKNVLNVPHIMILTPDTYVVVDLVKELKAKFNNPNDEIQVQV